LNLILTEISVTRISLSYFETIKNPTGVNILCMYDMHTLSLFCFARASVKMENVQLRLTQLEERADRVDQGRTDAAAVNDGNPKRNIENTPIHIDTFVDALKRNVSARRVFSHRVAAGAENARAPMDDRLVSRMNAFDDKLTAVENAKRNCISYPPMSRWNCYVSVYVSVQWTRRTTGREYTILKVVWTVFTSSWRTRERKSRKVICDSKTY